MKIYRVTGATASCAVITMRRRNTPLKFVLFPMAHIARPEFYRQVRQRLDACDLIIAEGVNGGSWRLRVLLSSYRFIPRRRRNGVIRQDYGTLLPPGVPVVCPDATSDEVLADMRELPRWEYLLLLVAAPVVGLVLTVRGPGVIFLRQPDTEVRIRPTRVGVRMPERDHNEFDRVMLARRDRMLVEELGRIHEDRRREPITVAVVYGAAHMRTVYAELLVTYGYRPLEPEWLTVFSDCK